MNELEPTLTSLRKRAVVLRQGRWSDGPEDAELMEHAADAIEGIDAENAKLRELVDYITPIAWYAASERERNRMRELGIEVDK